MREIMFKKTSTVHKEVPIFKFAIREDLIDTGNQFIPTRATNKSTGWDVKAAFEDRKSYEVSVGEYIKIPLGFRTCTPNGWWYELKPRSSSFVKKNLHSLYGTIDEDYYGQLIFACQYLPPFCFINEQIYGPSSSVKREMFGPIKIEIEKLKLTIEFGEAIGQIIPVKRQEMVIETITNQEYDTLCNNKNSTRGAGGFGSTGK